MIQSERDTVIVFIKPETIKAVVRRDPIRWGSPGPARTEQVPWMMPVFINYVLKHGINPTPTCYYDEVVRSWNETVLSPEHRKRVMLTYAACCNSLNVAALCILHDEAVRCYWSRATDQQGSADVVVERRDGAVVTVGLAMDSNEGRAHHEIKMNRAHRNGTMMPDVMLWLPKGRNTEGTNMSWYEARDVLKIFTY